MGAWRKGCLSLPSAKKNCRTLEAARVVKNGRI
jgi:hypothetical protein